MIIFINSYKINLYNESKYLLLFSNINYILLLIYKKFISIIFIILLKRIIK